MKLSTTAIKRSAAAIILMAATAVVGILGYSRLPANLLPGITYPLVKVYVSWREPTDRFQTRGILRKSSFLRNRRDSVLLQ